IWCGGEVGLNQHLFKVTSDLYPKWFYYMWVVEYLHQFIRIAADRATTMGHIKRQHLTEAQVLVAPKDQLDKMGKVLTPIIEKIIQNKVEKRSLESLRDTLLPKLMSGEIRVSELC
ncbi:MAG: restriction endonuclease subunit S, partial [Turicibacter sp.]